MRDIFLYIMFAVIGAAAMLFYFRSCSPMPKPETKITHDTVTERVYIPSVQGEGKSVLKYTYGGMLHDTVTERIYITADTTISGFTATLDTIQNNDTLHLEFNYPSAMFRYQLSRQPIEFKVVNTTTEIVRFEQVQWYEKPLFVSSITAGVLVGIFGVVR